MTGIEDVLQQQEDGGVEATPEPVEIENKEVKTEEKVEGKEEEGEKKEEAEGEEPKTEPEPEVETPAVPPDNTELNELRQFIREQRKEIAAMRAKLSRVKEQGEVDDEGNTVVTYTPLEKLQIELHNVAVSRSSALSDMVELMELNPKFEDVKEVCTKANFDDIFELAATSISRNEGRDFNEVLIQLELEVWKKPNPYKYMYGVIKENHPKFKVAPTPTTKKEELKTTIEDAIKEKPVTAKKVLEAKAAPGSVAAAGAGENLGTGGWTAAKIDSLDELELHQVPKEIYQKYMMGKLK